jgi:aprataxin
LATQDQQHAVRVEGAAGAAGPAEGRLAEQVGVKAKVKAEVKAEHAGRPGAPGQPPWVQGAAAAGAAAGDEPAAKRPKQDWAGSGGWAAGLNAYLDNPSDPAVVHTDGDIMAVADKYPKARHHWLVMPRDESYTHYRDLRASDSDLLLKMRCVGDKLIAASGVPASDFAMGFHAVPSMTHLHLHVVSQDFDSPCLKNKKHWNSFTTDFFVPLDEMRKAVLTGAIRRGP